MDRNADDMFGATGGQGSATGASSSFGATGAGMAGSSAPAGGLDPSANSASELGTTDPAIGADQSKTAVADKLGPMKDKARAFQSTLADKLDAGAEKLRQRNLPATLAGVAEGQVAVATDDRMTQVNDSVARGMQVSADWLRNGDLKADIDRQVRDHPGRTLLIAVGVGYLLAKAFDKRR